MSPEEEHDAEVVGERVGNRKPGASGGSYRQPGERVAWAKQGHIKPPLRCGKDDAALERGCAQGRDRGPGLRLL